MIIPVENQRNPGVGIRVEHFSFLMGMAIFLLIIASGLPHTWLCGDMPSISQSLQIMGESPSFGVHSDVKRAAFSLQEEVRPERSGLPEFSGVRQHLVREGETLSRIAAFYGLKPTTILAFNRRLEPKKVRMGQKLLIPASDGFPYRVVSRDTPEGVAAKLRLEGEQQRAFLALWPKLPEPGTVILVPGESRLTERYAALLSRIHLFPVDGTVTMAYGEITDPVTGLKTFHEGIDLAVPRGTPVRATRGGLVAHVQIHQALGYCVILRHDDGLTTLYGQLEEVVVAEGSRIKQGEILGKVGNQVFGKVDHLYFSVKKNGRVIDPLTVLY